MFRDESRSAAVLRLSNSIRRMSSFQSALHDVSVMLLQAEIFSAPTGTKAAFVVKCTKGRRHKGGFHCTYGRGPAKPAYTHP
jgi:hypothetical protein